MEPYRYPLNVDSWPGVLVQVEGECSELQSSRINSFWNGDPTVGGRKEGYKGEAARVVSYVALVHVEWYPGR